MEAGFELEDDVFFADLSKQISLLIMDDDDDDSLSRCPAVNLQAFTQAIHPARSQASTFLSYDHHQQQQTNKREISKGTGVFIPLSSHPRRKNVRQGRFSTGSTNKFQGPSDHNSYSSRGISHNNMAYNNNNINYQSHDSFNNIRRF